MRVYAKEKVPSVITDNYKKSLTSSVSVEVTLLDANDNNPTFVPSNLYEFRIPGDARPGDVVGQVSLIDVVEGGKKSVYGDNANQNEHMCFSALFNVMYKR